MDMNGKKRPLVGIALLAYNYGRYIDEAIESLKMQTFQDFEVFLLDDGSNDGTTPEKLRSVQYNKITKKLLYKTNVGNAERRRKQYEIMENKYILDMSGDDRLAPEFLEKTVAFLEKHPSYGAVSTDALEYMDTFDGQPFAVLHFNRNKMGLPEMLSECHCLGTSLMRKKALDSIDLSGGIKRYQDWDRWISMLEAGWQIGLVPEPLFMYRLHNDSLSHSSSAKIETEVFRKMMQKHRKLYNIYSNQIIEALFTKFQESGFFNKRLSRQFLSMKEDNDRLKEELNKRIEAEQAEENRTFSQRLLGKLKKRK